MKENLSRLIRNMPLKKKILYILLLNIFFITLAALWGFQLTMDSNQKLLYKSIAGSLSYSATDIANRLTNIQTMSGMILADATIQQDLSIAKDSGNYIARTQAYQSLNSLIPEYYQSFKTNNISYINLYNPSYTTYTNKPHSDMTPDEVHRYAISQAGENPGAPHWITRYGNEYGLFLSRDIRRIYMTQLDTLGTLVIAVNLEQMIASATEFSNQYENASYLLFDNGEPVFHSPDLTRESVMHINKKLTRDYDVLKLDGKNYFAVHGRIPTYGWDYICLVSYDSIAANLTMSRVLCFIIIIVTVIISLLLSRTLIQSVTGHLDSLMGKMEAFGKDETTLPQTVYDYSARNDELGVLHRRFDHMAGKIQHLIQVNYVSELLKKEAQLKALENQINPHFLYNTLESVNWRAKAIGEKDISSMVESLGMLLRLTLSRKELGFTLKEELDLVRCYMTIQKIRFEERLEYDILIPEAYAQAKILKLTIQPLAENAIQYGLEENTGNCRIRFTACHTGQVLSIYIKNNGSQFEPDLLDKLKSREIQPRGLGIGLLNIEQRLKLSYGESYGLTFYNEEELAVARIDIPYSPQMPQTTEEDGTIC